LVLIRSADGARENLTVSATNPGSREDLEAENILVGAYRDVNG
jgi:hypothetical protein